MNLTPNTAYPFDPLQISRRSILSPHIFEGLSALEIGPFDRPTLLKSEVDVKYADYYDTEELLGQINADRSTHMRVPEVDYVLRDSNLWDVVDEPVDLIIANHVVEHLIDPFRWIHNLEQLLNRNGLLFVTLPDKKYSFDRFRSDTTLSHFIADFIHGGEKSLAEHCIEASLFYDYQYSDAEANNRLETRFTKDFALSACNSFHPGMHVHVFQAETFHEHILLPFLSLGFINFQCIYFFNNPSLGEFTYILRRHDGPFKLDPSTEYCRAVDSSFQEQE